jgi:hypothetical protein
MGTSAWLWLFHFPRLRLLFHVHISNLFDEDYGGTETHYFIKCITAPAMNTFYHTIDWLPIIRIAS